MLPPAERVLVTGSSEKMNRAPTKLVAESGAKTPAHLAADAGGAGHTDTGEGQRSEAGRDRVGAGRAHAERQSRPPRMLARGVARSQVQWVLQMGVLGLAVHRVVAMMGPGVFRGGVLGTRGLRWEWRRFSGRWPRTAYRGRSVPRFC